MMVFEAKQLMREIDDLRQQLTKANAENERMQAHNAMMRKALIECDSIPIKQDMGWNGMDLPPNPSVCVQKTS